MVSVRRVSIGRGIYRGGYRYLENCSSVVFALIGESRFTEEDSPRLCTHACTVERVVPVVDRRLTTSSYRCKCDARESSSSETICFVYFPTKTVLHLHSLMGQRISFLGSRIRGKKGGNKLFSTSNC